MGKLTHLRRSSKPKSGAFGGGRRGFAANATHDFAHLMGARGWLTDSTVRKQPPAAAKPAPATEANAWASKVAKAQAKQAIRDQKKHEKRQAEWSTKSETQRQQIKQRRVHKHRAPHTQVVHRRRRPGAEREDADPSIHLW